MVFVVKMFACVAVFFNVDLVRGIEIGCMGYIEVHLKYLKYSVKRMPSKSAHLPRVSSAAAIYVQISSAR